MANVLFKKGTLAQYNTLSTKSDDTLYFIEGTDNKGIIYKGEKQISGYVKTVSKATDGKSLTITLFDDTVITASFAVAADLTAVQTALEASLTTHAAITGGSTKGHVSLSDSTNSTSSTSSGIAATPKAVKDALDAAKSYADGRLAANDAMVFKGTLGTGGTVSALPTTNYGAGHTYRIITAGTYAGQTCEVGDLIICIKDYVSGATINNDWTVVQTNIDGSLVVTSGSTLTADTVILGAGTKTAKSLANGSNGQVLKMVSGKPAWSTDNDTNTKISVANSTSKMFLVGTAAATGAQTGVSNAAVYATNGALNAASVTVTGSFTGSGAGLTNVPVSALTGVATSVTSGNTAPVTSGAVHAAISNAVAGAVIWETIA